MDQGDRILQAVLANPDDGSLCGVYADWLEEHGDPRGEFLRIICSLAALAPNDHRRGPWEARLQELRQCIDPAWRASVEFRLPLNFVEFLAAGEQLEYDPETCEAGAVTLYPIAVLSQLTCGAHCGGTPHEADDPHPGAGVYLVPGVDLIASCTGDYEPEGLLLWFPGERSFGVWDSSHDYVLIFGRDVSWSQIARSPARYINAQWGFEGLDRAPQSSWCRGPGIRTSERKGLLRVAPRNPECSCIGLGVIAAYFHGKTATSPFGPSSFGPFHSFASLTHNITLTVGAT